MLLSLPEGYRSLNDFPKCFKLPLSLLQSKAAIARAVELVLENECRQNVIYAELRFAPQLPTKNYRTFFKLAAEKNIPFTIHAGEAAGAESVRCAVEMGAARIGHGVRIFEDEPLMDIIQKRSIPLKRYLERGIKAALNTDAPGILKNTLADEFVYARDVCRITQEQERKLLFNAVDAAFTDEATKKMLRERLG